MVNHALEGWQTRVERARRYGIGAELRYRVRGEREWREGVMENISITGLLMRTTHSLEPNTLIEMRFVLPIELNGECAAEVMCRGSVVRSSGSPLREGFATIAARIEHFRFLRQMHGKEEFAS
jgi:hypothetical protein